MKKFLTLIAFFAINSLASAQILKDANLDANFLNHSVVPHHNVRGSAVAAEANQVFNDIKLDMKSGDTWQAGDTRYYDIQNFLNGQPGQMGTSGTTYLTYDPHSRHIFAIIISNYEATITTQNDAWRKVCMLSYAPIDATNLADTVANTTPWKSHVLFDTTSYKQAGIANANSWGNPSVAITNPTKSSNVKDVHVAFVTQQELQQPGTNWRDQHRAFGFSTVKDLADGIAPPIVLQLQPEANNPTASRRSYNPSLKGLGANIDGKPYVFFYGDGYNHNATTNGDYTYSYTLAAFNLEDGDMEKSQNLPSKIMQQIFNDDIMTPNQGMWGTYALDNDDKGNLYFAFNNALNVHYLNQNYHNVFKQIKVPTVIKTKYVNDGDLALDFNDMVLDTLPLQVVADYVNDNGGVSGDFQFEENHAWSFAYGPSADGRWDIAFNVIAEDEYSFFLPLVFNDGVQMYHHYVEVASKNKNWTIRKIAEIQGPASGWQEQMYYRGTPPTADGRTPITTIPVHYMAGSSINTAWGFQPTDNVLYPIGMRDLQLARTTDNEYYIAKWVSCHNDDAVNLNSPITFKGAWGTSTSPETKFFEVNTVYKTRVLMSYRHKNDATWSAPVEPAKSNDFSMIRTFMPKVVSSINEVPFTFYYVYINPNNPVQSGLPFNFMKYAFWGYARNYLVIGDAENGFTGSPILGPNTSIEEGDASDAYSLSNAYPNPTSNEITFRFSLEQPAHTTLVITNTLGQTVATVLDQFCNGSDYTVKFDTGKLPIGTYYYTLTSGSRIETKMFTVVR